MKPTIASELNHVEKAIQTKDGVIIASFETIHEGSRKIIDSLEGRLAEPLRAT